MDLSSPSVSIVLVLISAITVLVIVSMMGLFRGNQMPVDGKVCRQLHRRSCPLPPLPSLNLNPWLTMILLGNSLDGRLRRLGLVSRKTARGQRCKHHPRCPQRPEATEHYRGHQGDLGPDFSSPLPHFKSSPLLTLRNVIPSRPQPELPRSNGSTTSRPTLPSPTMQQPF
jgi:hypothetical protein